MTNKDDKGAMTMEISVQEITPTMAEKWLEANIDNRRLRPKTVEYFVELMQRGEWLTTHQGIAFDENGRLVDGQHRLMAIIRAGIPARMVVTEGLAADAYKALDQGVMRTMSDLVDETPKKVAAAKFLVDMKHNFHKRRSVLSDVELVLGKIGPAFEHLISEGRRTTIKVWSSAPVRAAACLRIMYGNDPEFVCEQYGALITRDFKNISDAFALMARQYDGKRFSYSESPDIFHKAFRCFEEYGSPSRIAVRETDKALAKLMIDDIFTPVEKAKTAKKPVSVKELAERLAVGRQSNGIW